MISIRQKIVALNALTIVTFLVLIAIAAGTQRGAKASAALAERSEAVMLAAQSLTTTLTEIQLTDRSTQLWRRALRDVPPQVARLERLAAMQSSPDSFVREVSVAALRAIALQRITAHETATRRAERRRAMAEAFICIEALVAAEGRAGHVRSDSQLDVWRRNDAFALAMILAIGLVLIVANMSFSRDLVVRLERLSENTRLVALGEEAHEPVRGTDEVARLDRSFHAMARALKDRNDLSQRYLLLGNATNDSFIVMRRSDGRIVEANTAAVLTYGYEHDEFLNLSVSHIRAPETLGDIEERFAQVDRGPLVFETSHKRKDGTTFPVEVSCAIAQLAGERVVVTVARDVTERKRAEAAIARAEISDAARIVLEREVEERKNIERRLAFAAFHDALTGLPNRAFFTDRLRHVISLRPHDDFERTAVLFLDLDRFKLINDSLGHGAGDELLVELARRLNACLRTGDTLARFGGDEFTFLLENVADAPSVIAFARRILTVFDVPFRVAERDVFAAASIGIALGRPGTSAAEDLVRDADTAMYDAKSRGIHYALFAPALLERAIVLQKIETDIRHALSDREFRVFYQPIVALGDARLHGFEALIRWQHPTRGLLGPSTFIDVAESTGAIVPIGDWVLEEACRQMQAWRERHPGARDLTISVNVSAQQLALPTFAATALLACERSGFPASRLNVEITESTIVQNAVLVRSNLEILRDAGVRVHLDDFGTGYSSLSHLHNLEIDVLKIDRSFVSSAGAEIANPEIVRTILALARHLRIDVTAEGIETAEQLQTLRELDCPHGQGYLFSRPVDASHAHDLIVASLPSRKALGFVM